MNTKRIKFASETRFEVKPVPGVPFRATQETELERLKERLLREELNAVNEIDLHARLRRAATEATALVWLTPYPLLLLPTLFAEKTRAARNQFLRQQNVRARSRDLLHLAA